MGVRSLSSFFKLNPDLTERFRLHDSRVIFDGNNLLYALFFDYEVDFLYGGDYKEYAKIIKGYLSIYLECNIQPIVIFDGGYEDRKLKTVIERFEDRLKYVQELARYRSCSGMVLPIMAYKVIISVLIDLGIPFAQCDYEADAEVPALANYYNCPVISNDSDFYIFDVHCGFICLDSVDMTINILVDSDGTEYKFLNCNMYYIDKFVSYYPGLDKKVMPVLGTLMGNDYVEYDQFDIFFLNVQFPKYKGKRKVLVSSFRHKKLMNLLCWLQNKTANEAVNEVTRYLQEDKREYVKCIIENSINGYELKPCNLSFIIDNNINDLRNEHSRLVTRCGNPLPIDFVVKFNQGYLPAIFINIITHHRVFLNPQVDNVTFPSSYTCARFIRRILYGILVRHDTNTGNCENQCCLSSIEEYDRQGSSLKIELVEPIFSLEGFGRLPSINEIHCLQNEKCKEIIFKVLGLTSDFVLNLPEEWQLLMGCINYWLRHSKPHTSEAFIYALILNLIYFSVIKYKTLIVNKIACTNKTSLSITPSQSVIKIRTLTTIECTCSITCTLANISESSLKHANKNFKQYLKKHLNRRYLNIIHDYNQLQTCILTITSLNELLGNFMKNPAAELCFNGTMLYNLAKNISSCPNPELFVAEFLGQDSNLHLLFLQLISKICENVPRKCILKEKSSHGNKDSISNKVKGNFSNNKFDILANSELL